ncbi:Mpo1-like protein [Pseudoalteromonas sp. MER144-MNA-CIBAN-0113]|uniref:Mpo1 family 2-hydroxy fatty acid dioxygenase n=1 Tax=Pseudoalteromonas sp. MER144-MNA-CIBAN-0113 TaxID=3140429 RepID=UPI003330165B
MKTLQQQLGQYGLYHRSKRNVLTHFFGIPLIVFAALCLLARVEIPIGSFNVDGAQLFVLASVVYYFMLSFSLGLIMGIIFTVLLVAAQPIAAMPFTYWLTIGVGVFLFGWVLQFIGHYFEGKKPAFVDDLVGLIIGPLYVTAELLFLMGFYKNLEQQVNEIAGPTKA